LDVPRDHSGLLAFCMGCSRLGTPHQDERISFARTEPLPWFGPCTRLADKMALCGIHGNSIISCFHPPPYLDGRRAASQRRTVRDDRRRDRGALVCAEPCPTDPILRPECPDRSIGGRTSGDFL